MTSSELYLFVGLRLTAVFKVADVCVVDYKPKIFIPPPHWYPTLSYQCGGRDVRNMGS